MRDNHPRVGHDLGRRERLALRREGLLPQWNLVLNVATLVAILGVFALVSLIAGM